MLTSISNNAKLFEANSLDLSVATASKSAALFARNAVFRCSAPNLYRSATWRSPFAPNACAGDRPQAIHQPNPRFGLSITATAFAACAVIAHSGKPAMRRPSANLAKSSDRRESAAQ
ncbi:MAG TPA: hypothetical protein VIY51_26285 [Xanthobacteraceae bacterium]